MFPEHPELPAVVQLPGFGSAGFTPRASCRRILTLYTYLRHHTVGPRVRHNPRCCTTMPRSGFGYHDCKTTLGANVRGFLYSLRPSTYDKMTPRVEFWIEYIIKEGFSTPKDLAEQLSDIAWHFYDINAEVPRFLKEFRDAPGRSEPTRSFVHEFCLHVLRFFAGATADYFHMDDSSGLIPSGGGNGFVRAAAFLGHLIKHGLLDRELVQWHVVKPLTLYNEGYPTTLGLTIRANAIYQLFTTAGDTLLQGLLEPGDVQDCFEILDAQVTSRASKMVGFDETRFNVQCLLSWCLTSEPNSWSRNSARFTLHGCSAKWKNKGIQRPPGFP